MTNIQQFKTTLENNHYSTAFIQHLVIIITGNESILCGYGRNQHAPGNT